jgi:hypothetical protein
MALVTGRKRAVSETVGKTDPTATSARPRPVWILVTRLDLSTVTRVRATLLPKGVPIMMPAMTNAPPPRKKTSVAKDLKATAGLRPEKITRSMGEAKPTMALGSASVTMQTMNQRKTPRADWALGFSPGSVGLKWRSSRRAKAMARPTRAFLGLATSASSASSMAFIFFSRKVASPETLFSMPFLLSMWKV